MPRYLFGGHDYSPEHENWQRILQEGYASRLRPVCQCLVQGERPSLYIALVRGQYLLKRLPYSGPLHAPHCEHYEPPPELSGLGQVNGSAIREVPQTQTTTLTLDFALTKGRSRQAGAVSAVEHESVRSDGTKLTMRGLLHFLLDDAGLTRWTPAMAGRRSWYVVRRELLNAASSKTAKGQPLADLLYIPESFALERADAIKQRQRDALARLSSSPSTRMILVGEVKAIEDARYGKCVVVKHMPDLKLLMTDDLHRQLVSRFEHPLQLWGQLEASHLLMLATISRSSQGIHALEAVCLMNVNEHWIGFETLFEWELLSALHGRQRRFTKGLRYNLPSKKALACAVLQDTGDAPTALFVIPQGLEGEYDTTIDGLTAQGRLRSWRWRAGAESMPALPLTWLEQRHRQARTEPQAQMTDEQAPVERYESALSGGSSEPGEAFEQPFQP